MNNENKYSGADLEDIASFSSKAKDDKYEDIVSSSSGVRRSNNQKTVDFNSFSNYGQDDAHYYRKKKRGLSKIVNDIGSKLHSWWGRSSQLKDFSL